MRCVWSCPYRSVRRPTGHYVTDSVSGRARRSRVRCVCLDLLTVFEVSTLKVHAGVYC